MIFKNIQAYFTLKMYQIQCFYTYNTDILKLYNHKQCFLKLPAPIEVTGVAILGEFFTNFKVSGFIPPYFPLICKKKSIGKIKKRGGGFLLKSRRFKGNSYSKK